MNAEHINFMLALRSAIDKQTAALGATNPTVKQLWTKFNALWKRDLTANNPQNTAQLQQIQQDVNLIKERLMLHCPPSIDYSFVRHELTRQQLQFDNLRMENNVYQIDRTNQKFIDYQYEYCSLAFLQVEEILNYYYSLRFDNMQDFLNNIKQFSPYEQKPNFSPSNVSQIAIYFKVSAFGGEFLPYINSKTGEEDYTVMNIQNLRTIRNKTAHRCTILKNQNPATLTPEEDKIVNFLYYKGINQIRELLQIFMAKVADCCALLP